MENIKIGIYKITSPNGNIYIGQSSNIKKRFNFYKNLKCKLQLRLYNSFIKYGVENHKFEIICECEKIKLDCLEKFYIKEYNTFNTKHGLNLREGGNTSNLSEESKEKIRQANIGKKQSKETIQKIRLKMIGENHPMFGKKQNNEWKKKRVDNMRISGIMFGKKHTEETKDKLRKINIGKVVSIETKNKLRKINIGKKLTTEHKNKISNSLIGKKRDEISRLKMSNSSKGKSKSDTHKENIKLSLIGRKKSYENKKTMSIMMGENNPMFGRKGKLNHLFGRKIDKETLIKREESKRNIRQERLMMTF
jgi:group I intron endonuclease